MWYYKTILNDTSRLPRCEITPDFNFQTFGTVDNVTYRCQRINEFGFSFNAHFYFMASQVFDICFPQ